MTNLFRHAAVCACAVFTISSAAVGAAAPAPVASAGTVNPSLFADMHWRLIGPFRGGRALAVTGVPGPGRPGFRNTISLDQFAAEHIGSQTRFPSIVLTAEGAGLSWTRTGALVPAAISPSKVFARLFLEAVIGC